MSRSYILVEKSQTTGLGMGAGWWFVVQGKFDEMAPLSFVGQSGVVATSKGPCPIEVADARLRNGVLSLKLDGVDGLTVPRQAQLTMGSA